MDFLERFELQESSFHVDAVIHPCRSHWQKEQRLLKRYLRGIRSNVQGIYFSKIAGIWHRRDNVKFLDSYLAPRVGNIVVQGQCANNMIIDNNVFQDNVLGPPLWNSLFSDASVSDNLQKNKNPCLPMI